MNAVSVRPSLAHRWSEWRGALLFLLLMFAFRSAWADWVTVPTGSMNPTILEGDRVLVDKHVYGLRVPFTLLHLTAGADPRRGDIIVFDSPADRTSLIKRVIGEPGDVIALYGETLVINGRPCDYRPAPVDSLRGLLASTAAENPQAMRESGVLPTHNVMLLPGHRARSTVGPLVVPADMYFVLGDNRDNSADSRYIGFVPRRNIVGRASRVVLSFNPEHYFLPRSGRWLRPLR